jgi:hypothetical protein
LLNYAARDTHLGVTIRPALARGAIVLCDRFMDSTTAYQGHAGGVDLAFIRSLEHAVVGDTRPQLTLVFDVDPELGLERARQRDPGNADRFERMDLAFHQRLRAGFLEIARAEPGRCVLVGAYALGKAQRLILELRGRGYEEPIYIHGALERLCRLYEELGVSLGELRLATGAAKSELQDKIILCPPGALNDRWSRRLPDPITAMASGWMRIRQRARQRNVELPLIISDHADWDELTLTIREVAPKEVWITHGREDALMHWCQLHQIKARELNLVGYEDEDD